MGANDNFKIINFRLNLDKKEERELYDYLENIDKGGLKACYGSKSGFIKEVLMAHMHGGNGGSTAGTSTQLSRDEIKALVKEVFMECADVMNVAVVKSETMTGGVASTMEEATETPDEAKAAVPEQADKLPDDAMDYLKELYG
jgi:hypothetical protein